MEVKKATPEETARWLVNTYDSVAPVTVPGDNRDTIAVLKIAARLADFVATQYGIGDLNE